MTKWKYTTSQDANVGSHEAMHGANGALTVLNGMGQDGWEVAAWIPLPSSDKMVLGHFLLKRAIP